MFDRVSQLFQQGGLLNTIVQLIFTVAFLLFLFYGQQIQCLMTLRKIEVSLEKIRRMRDEGRAVALETIKEVGKPDFDPAPKLDSLLEYFMITPVDLDPSGIVWKLEHLMNVREERFRQEIREISPKASESELHNLENMVEAAMALNTIYKITRHYYLLGKKTMSLYIILQLQMMMPMIMKYATAYMNALKAFSNGAPIGDGVGALVAAKLANGRRWRRVAKDTIAAKVDIDGRTVYVVKAEGPGGNVGKPGDAVLRIIEEEGGRVSTIIMVDAALKLEGEETGSVAEGVGAAIGGIGVERYKIEEIALKYKIPTNAIVIKEDISEAISPMKEEIANAADKVVETIKNFIRSRVEEGGVIIVTGVGNTIGIGQ